MAKPQTIPHRWHPVFIHFPITCWVLATGLDVATMLMPVRNWVPGVDLIALAHLFIWLGVAVSIPAVIAGLIDYRIVSEEATGMIDRHATWMIAAITLFLIAGIWRLRGAAFDAPIPTALLFVELAGSMALVVGGRVASIVVFGHCGSVRSTTR